jgi:1-aminocyclopropane-1-carboxylate deaminase
MNFFNLPSSVQQLKSKFLDDHGVELWLKRDDLIHTEISGNKWRKLKYNIQEATNRGYHKLLTFGGAYSNHIAATAAVGKLLGIQTIGVIRGDEGFENKTLSEAKLNGMHMHFVSRAGYKLKTTASFQHKLEEHFGEFYLIPEGGASELGVQGCEEILQEVNLQFDAIAVSAGTGTTASGICRQLKNEKLIVFPALKGGSFILEEMEQYCDSTQLAKVQLQLEYHFGGYGKTKPEQLAFMSQFFKEYKVELDKIYTSKMMFGLFDLIQKSAFKRGDKILAIHTGGLQGN